MAVCQFCQAVADGADEYILYESDRTLALLDKHPAVEGHTLVIPKDHRAALLEGDDASSVFEAVQTVSARLSDVLRPDGFSVFYTTETLLGTFEHAHVHLLPRWEDDEVSLAIVRGSLDPDDAEALATAVRNRD